MKFRLFLLSFLVSFSLSASENEVIFSFIGDIKKQLWSPIEDCKIIRVTKDLNGDSIPDLMLSTNCSWSDYSWGNGGGSWKVYFSNESGKFMFLTNIEFHPLAVNIESKPDLGGFILNTYWRNNAESGVLLKELVTTNQVKLIEKRNIIPGPNDQGKDTALYYKLFGDNYKTEISEYCLIVEFEAGKCVWAKGY